MRLRHMLVLVTALLLVSVPAAAMGAKSQHSSKPMPKVLFVLRGSLSDYTAASGSTNGSISIMVKSSNMESKALKGMMLTFATDSKTKVVLHDRKPIADGDRGIVKVRAAKGSDAAALQTQSVRGHRPGQPHLGSLAIVVGAAA